MPRTAVLLIITLTCPCWTHEADADDWPQWLGPQRDSVWREEGIVDRFPETGLKFKWRAEVSLGYAGPAVAEGRVYVADYVKNSGEITNNPGRRDKLEGSERVLCFDAATGQLLWKHEYAQAYELSYPGGPRATPTVAGGKVYTLGTEGRLVCLNTADGKLLWEIDFKQAYNAQTPMWGFAAHPLVDGQSLYCLVGGSGSMAVAFDKDTGKELWRALDAKDQGYSPPTMIEHAGTKQLVIWHSESINGLDPADGKTLWSVPLKPDFGMAIAAPRQLGSMIYASGVRNAGALIELAEGPGANILWRGAPDRAIYSASVTPFLEGEVMYGCDGAGTLVCAKLSDGTRLWETAEPTTGQRGKRYATAFLVKHQDRFFLFNDSGDLILARLSPEGYQELGRFHVLEPTNSAMGRPVVWSHPAFAQKCLFARNDKELVCVSLAADQSAHYRHGRPFLRGVTVSMGQFLLRTAVLCPQNLRQGRLTEREVCHCRHDAIPLKRLQ
jgi:outer membrane protein assembly factor BamB